MKGIHKHSPTTGAELSREKRYPGTIPLRESLEADGELTNGELVSRNATALLRYFKRCHAKHGDPDTDLYFAAWQGIQALRAGDDEEESDPWDVWLWYSLAERLDRRGFDVDWMLGHAEPRCPRCSSRLKHKPAAAGYPKMICGASCGAETSSDRTVEIYERIKDVYNATFPDDAVDSLRVF